MKLSEQKKGQGHSTFTIDVIEDRGAFEGLKDEWNGLVAVSESDNPYLAHEWFEILWNHYFDPETFSPRIYTLRDGSGLRLVAPLVRSRGKKLLTSTPGLTSMTNERTNRFDLIYRKDDTEALDAFLSYVTDTEKEMQFLELQYLPKDTTTFEYLEEFCSRRNLHSYSFQTIETPYFELDSDFDGFMKGLKTKFKSNMRNREKRLSKLGKVSMEVVEGGPDLDGAVESVCRIEEMSWKGEEGLSITSTDDVRDLYLEYASTAAQHGWLRLYFLKLDDRPIAFDYAVEYNRKLYLLRTGFDPDYSAYSPGQLLKRRVFESAFDNGIVEYDFLGGVMDWKRDWTRLTRKHSSFFMYNRQAGASLEYFMRFGWKKTIKNLKGNE